MKRWTIHIFLTIWILLGCLSLAWSANRGPISSGETRPGNQLAAPSYLDTWTFSGKAGDRVLVNAEPTSGSSYVYIGLYPPGGGSREVTGWQSIDHQLLQTGLYTIVIYEYYSNAKATYDLTFLKLPDGPLFSAGDPDGGEIASGETIAPGGELSISDMDAFQFYGDAGDRVLVNAEPTSGSSYVYIGLYPPGGGSREVTGWQSIDHQLLQTGLYTIVIYEYYSNAKATYDLTFLKLPDGPLFSAGDPDGGEIASGETIAPGGELSISDMDAFQFYGDAGDRVLVNAEPTSGSSYVYIGLYPPDGGSREVTGWQSIDHQLRQTGLYTIVIYEYYSNAKATYDLTFLKLPGAVSSPGDPDGGAIASGETIAPGGELSISDMDAFQFYGDAGDRVLVNAEPTSGSSYVYIGLYPPGAGSREVTGWQSIDHQLRQTGLYTIVIYEYYSNAKAIYNLSLAKIPSQLRPGLYDPSPSDGDLICNLNNSFSWKSVSGATGYDLYFGENVTVPLKKIGNNLRSPSMAFPEMKINKIYYWHVVARTSTGEIQGPYWWFQTQACGTTDEIIGTWSDGIYYFYPPYWSPGQSRMYASTPDGDSPSGDIEAGDTNSDGYADVASCWSTGLYLQDGRTRDWELVYSMTPYRVTMADVYGDARKEVIGTFSDGVKYFYRTISGWNWRLITAYPPAGDITAGDITGDGWDEVVSGYSTGTWVWNPRSGGWLQLTSATYIPYSLACGDRNGDGLAEVVGTFHTGIWSWDRGRWSRLTDSGFATTGDMEMGDFNNNGRDDLVSCWPDGMWIQYDNGSWYKAYNIAPYRVTAGDVIGN